jgi:hypothetical protein
VLGLIATAAYAFQPHGVIRNTVAATEAPAPAAATRQSPNRGDDIIAYALPKAP